MPRMCVGGRERFVNLAGRGQLQHHIHARYALTLVLSFGSYLIYLANQQPIEAIPSD